MVERKEEILLFGLRVAVRLISVGFFVVLVPWLFAFRASQPPLLPASATEQVGLVQRPTMRFWVFEWR